MKIRDILKAKKFVFSLEIFPPKPEADISVIYSTLDELKQLKPDFVSVTYGAGGSNRGRTVEIADRINNHYKIPALAHLTCVNATKDYIMEVLTQLKSKGVENIMALGGDLPKDVKDPIKDFRHASDLVAFIRKSGFDFSIGVAGYPEKHPAAPSMEKDIENLKIKVDAGADFITTQLFLDNDFFYSYRDRVQKAGINVPVIPGIMTATKLLNLEKMTAMCGVSIPERFRTATATCAIDNPVCDETVKYTVNQINHLIKHGAKGIHLYSMNKAGQNMRIYNESAIAGMRK
jgi:methylenetetrahydrofolate reductase (NADPH)